MKTVIVHNVAKPIEKDWATQFAGLDAAVKAQFSTAVDWTNRTPRVFTIQNLTWASIVSTVSAAAQAAGAGGVVIIASGHGGVGNQNNQGIINWDASDGDVARGWDKAIVKKGLFWDEDITEYVDPIPHGNPPTLKATDEQNIKKKTQNAPILQMRHDAFDALTAIGTALRANQVARLTFTVCTAGRATVFMDKLAKLCGVQVACFKFKTLVFDDGTLKITPGKARLIMEADQSRPGKGTNIPNARVFSPDLDDSTIAYVAHP